jgi:uncharacterized protein
MIIVFDEYKRIENLKKHGFDFADLTDDFFAAATITDAKQGRLIAIGFLFEGVISTVFAKLGTEAISIISMRPASRKERKAHETT